MEKLKKVSSLIEYGSDQAAGNYWFDNYIIFFYHLGMIRCSLD